MELLGTRLFAPSISNKFIPRSYRFPAQQRVGGDSKIPTVLYYDKEGEVRAVGAEATQDDFIEEAEDNEYVRVEWYALTTTMTAMSGVNSC